MMKEWQPIDTAPRAEWVLVTDGKQMVVARLMIYPAGPFWVCPQDTDDDLHLHGTGMERPTHWMPLPPLPPSQ